MFALIKFPIIICFLMFFSPVYGQELKKVEVFIKVWGFLKYYHPQVVEGKHDWDKEFLDKVSKIEKIEEKEEINSFYSDWFDSLGKVNPCKRCVEYDAESHLNLDISWMQSDWFSEELRDKFKFILKNRSTTPPFYAHFGKLFLKNWSPDFKTENNYADSIYPAAKMRLLTLSRYWNIINYYYPYKYSLGKNYWDSILASMIQPFKSAPDTLSYQLAIHELTASIKDSHFYLNYSPQMLKYFGQKLPLIKFKILDTVAIVTGFLDDSLATRDDIRIGDIITGMDNRSIKYLISEKGKYIGASNAETKARDLGFLLLNGNSDIANLNIVRDGKEVEIRVQRYPFEKVVTVTPSNTYVPWKVMNGNIGYVDLGALKRAKVSKMTKELKNTKAIIFDVRNYPDNISNKLSAFLNNRAKQFAKITIPNPTFPGTYKERKRDTGKRKKNCYKGLVILLIDETTQSRAENMVMKLETAQKVVTIGSHTAGANGDIRIIPLPGGYIAYMSSFGIYYPDGRETQRVGIVPSVVVTPTIAGIKNGRDEALEKAIEYAQKH